MTTTEAAGSRTSREQLLDPIDRISEILFGLIMALTFTVTLDAATADGAEVRSMLIAALGCNIAWGLVDGVMYLSMGLVERAHGLRLMRDLRASDATAARSLLRESIPPVVAATLDDDELDRIRTMLDDVALPPRPRLRRDDVLGALAVTTLVFLSTFPVALPFAFIDDAAVALRTSNMIALALLFIAGMTLGRYGGVRPIRLGVLMAVLGSVLVAMTVALGG
jgi:hypothetical protein